MLERALDPGVESVEPVQRDRLGGGEVAHPQSVGPVVAEDAGQKRRAAVLPQPPGGGPQDLGPELQVPQQPALL